jgi:hypothetical protein
MSADYWLRTRGPDDGAGDGANARAGAFLIVEGGQAWITGELERCIDAREGKTTPAG